MADFDFAAAQKKIIEINKIIEGCPEAVKEKAFELLFHRVFEPPTHVVRPVHATAPAAKQEPGPAEQSERAEPIDAIKLPGNVVAFLRRYSIPRDTLDKLFMLDQTPHLQIYSITTSVTAQAQLQKVLMILLENAILTGSFKAPYKEMRESCKEAGLYDGNFNKTLKKNGSIFKGAVTADKINDDEEIELTGAGQARLAEVIAELAGTA
jgi:hypothetical protein